MNIDPYRVGYSATLTGPAHALHDNTTSAVCGVPIAHIEEDSKHYRHPFADNPWGTPHAWPDYCCGRCWYIVWNEWHSSRLPN